jgi:hypothetical protein
MTTINLKHPWCDDDDVVLITITIIIFLIENDDPSIDFPLYIIPL